MRRLSLFAITGSLLLVGCGQVTPMPTPTVHAGIVGRVLISGGPWPGSTQPYPASKVKVIDSSGGVVAVTTPTSNGTFRIDLPPGNYTVKAQPTSGNPWFGPEKASVRAGHYSKVDIYAQVP